MADTPLLKLGILAGEASGDNLGAGLMAEMSALHPNVEFVGVGGPRMIEQGLRALYPMDRLSVNGFVDPILRLPELLRMLLGLRDQLLEEQVSAFVGVDFNVFNLLLERRLKKRGIATAHYVSPSVYAWRRGRAKRISRSADLLLALYPFEAGFYKGMNVDVAYVGHPLAHALGDDASSVAARDAARASLGLHAETVIAVLPGSRNSEVALMGPVFFEAARIIAQGRDVQFVVPCLRPEIAERVEDLSAGLGNVVIHHGNARLPLTACDVGLVKSGTSTLEAMCLVRPFVVSYKLGTVTYQIARHMVRTPFVALPNILAGEALVPELLQDKATPDALAESVLAVLDRTRADDGYLNRFRSLRDQLRVGPRASSEAARVVLELALRQTSSQFEQGE